MGVNAGVVRTTRAPEFARQVAAACLERITEPVDLSVVWRHDDMLNKGGGCYAFIIKQYGSSRDVYCEITPGTSNVRREAQCAVWLMGTGLYWRFISYIENNHLQIFEPILFFAEDYKALAKRAAEIMARSHTPVFRRFVRSCPDAAEILTRHALGFRLASSRELQEAVTAYGAYAMEAETS